MELYDPTANATVADIATVPADFRFMYKAGENGQHTLDAENPAVKSSMAIFGSLKGALTKARNDLKGVQKVDLSALSDYGNDPASIAAKFKEKTEGLESQIKQVNIPKIKEGVEQEWKPKLQAALDRGKGLESQLYNTLVVNEATAALSAAKGEIDLLMPFVREQVRQVEIEGRMFAHVVDGKGETRYNGAGAPMTIRELIAEMKGNEKFGKLFSSDAPSGGGTKPGAPARKQNANNTAAAGEMSSTQKIAAGLKALSGAR